MRSRCLLILAMTLVRYSMGSSDLKKLNAVVIADNDYKEYDKLFTLFTKELGKIRAYAFNIRREHSKKIGLLRLFSFCEVDLKSSGDSYSLVDAKIVDSFEGLTRDYETMCYASYFVELVDYFSFENIEGDDVLRLLYYTFKALEREAIDKKLIKSVFELKLLKYQGEYITSDKLHIDNATLRYTWDYVINAESKDLYKFKLTDEMYRMFRDEVDREFKLRVSKKFKSLDKLSL